MADPISAIGLVASVIQVAGAGLKPSKEIYVYVESVKAADKRLQDVARHVEFTSSIIHELGAVLENQVTVELISESAVRTADGMVQECEAVFKEMAVLVEKSLGRGKKLLFPFREAKIELLRANLERLKSSLQLLMQVLMHAQVVASENRYSSEILLQREHINELVRAKEGATQRYEEERLKYQKLLEKLYETTANEPNNVLPSSNPTKAIITTFPITSQQEGTAVLLNTDLQCQSTGSLARLRSGSGHPEPSTRGGISRSELNYCISRLHTLIEEIEHARTLLQTPTLTYTGWAVSESYANIRTELDRYFLREKEKAPDTSSTYSGPRVVLDLQSEMMEQNKSLGDTAAGSAVADELTILRKMHEEELKMLKEDMVMAISGKDLELQRELEDMRQNIHKSIEITKRDRENLKISHERLAYEATREREQMKKKIEVLRSDNEVAKLLVEWTTISLESIE